MGNLLEMKSRVPNPWLFIFGLAMILPSEGFSQSNVKVSGLGLLGNMEMERRLAFLSGVPPGEPQALDHFVIEDIAYILLQIMRKDGYPDPQIQAHLHYEDGSEKQLSWSLPFDARVEEGSPEAGLASVAFQCDPGLLDFYHSVEIRGVKVIDEGMQADFFVPSGVLFTRRKDRAFTESNLESRLSRLLAAIRSHGYQQVRVAGREVERDPESGAVVVRIDIEEGPLHEIGLVTTEYTDAQGNRTRSTTEEFRGEILVNSWINDFRQSTFNDLYTRGFPDARVRVSRTPAVEIGPDRVQADLTFRAETGPYITFAGVEFKPEGLLKESVLRRQTNLRDLENYDLLAVEEGRRQLLALGVLRDVELEHVRIDDSTRKAAYTLSPGPNKSLVLLLGYGSYELGRVGFKWKHHNMWGRAHRYELELKQSFKSFDFDGRYVVPHFFDRRITAYFRTGYHFREEISYDRTTYEFVFGASRRMGIPGLNVSTEYALENQDTTRDSEPDFESLDRATVSSLSFRLSLDRRDSVLYPTKGFDASVYTKVASEFIGGNANFQTLGFSTSYHHFLGGATYVHLGLDYSTIFSGSPTSRNLPFNERLFPGGENSVRGYQRGEATSLTAEGEPIGAETFALVNLEIEQRIFSSFSVVLFWDGVVFDQNQTGIPQKEFLQSVGLGLRWRTPVGPIRLEYGRNIDPRPFDPKGTLHLSVGFPF